MSRPSVGHVSTTAQQHTGGFVAAKESHLMDGSSCAFRALHIALQLSRSLVSDLIVFLAPIPGISIEELRDLTKAMIGDPDPFIEKRNDQANSVRERSIVTTETGHG